MSSLPDASVLPPRLSPRSFDRWNGLVTAGEDADGREVLAPFTGEAFGSVPTSTPADVDRAVGDARDAHERWADRDVEARAAVFERFHDLILDRREELLDVMQLESGKSRGDAYEEVMDVAMTARYYATRAGDQLASERRRGALPFLSTARVHHDPVGVVGIIAPWNYPLTLAVGDAIPALLAGNAVVLKPAGETPYTALATVELLREAGLPHDAFHVVAGEGKRLGDPLIERVDYVSFTGSTAVGRQIAAKAGEELVDASLELGGKNPIYVRPDVDVDTAVERTIGACFTNAGQLCISAERVYVHEDVYDAFARRFVDAVGDLTLDSNYGYGVDVGSLVSESQLERVKRHVADARERGATVEVGGETRPDVGPYFYAPTVLTDLPADATAACEETFGPVVGMESVANDAEAVAEANDTEYGLHACILSGDVKRARAIAQDVDAGTVAINDGYMTAWAAHDAPMGGRNDSGLGRRHGPEGIERFTESKTVTTSRALPFSPVSGPTALEAKVLATGLKLWRRIPFLR
ncbi:succinate-semialdehyde dehydrogenase (NADP(+)) [Halorubellus sp. JP-L1]|uniref:succinic semialdehyde dehydrogenase n=1 Tax=Halorubellus sp. JP-L1 TaxID=2715753 RepID=UPI001407611D|nr:succinic semialdehyde dehydrogenase [Halorubellus sp. JP-L1]NHN43083.1 succinate-semialdehyde dehydrogenase (NADP(+)) [Halorubellus sp. JP-L1]